MPQITNEHDHPEIHDIAAFLRKQDPSLGMQESIEQARWLCENSEGATEDEARRMYQPGARDEVRVAVENFCLVIGEAAYPYVEPIIRTRLRMIIVALTLWALAVVLGYIDQGVHGAVAVGALIWLLMLWIRLAVWR